MKTSTFYFLPPEKMREMPLPGVLGQQYTVYGGPFSLAPKTAVRVKMAREIHSVHEISVPTEDFGVPSEQSLVDGLREAVKAILIGMPVFVGCRGGRGRTGLFLACLAKAWGIENPVQYVRQHYHRFAVETQEQERLVASLVIPPDIRWLIKISRTIARFSLSNSLTRPLS